MAPLLVHVALEVEIACMCKQRKVGRYDRKREVQHSSRHVRQTQLCRVTALDVGMLRTCFLLR